MFELIEIFFLLPIFFDIRYQISQIQTRQGTIIMTYDQNDGFPEKAHSQKFFQGYEKILIRLSVNHNIQKSANLLER